MKRHWKCSRGLCDWSDPAIEMTRAGPCPKCGCTEVVLAYQQLPLTDAELVALAALVQADQADILNENRELLAHAEYRSRVTGDPVEYSVTRTVADSPAYKRLAEELRRRSVLLGL